MSAFKMFRCTGCGDCCRRPGHVPITGPEGLAMSAAARELGIEAKFQVSTGRESGTQLRLVVDSVCPFLLDPGGICRLQARGEKPRHCQRYPFIPQVGVGMIPWSEIEKVCEGVREETPNRKEYSREDVFKIMVGEDGST